MSTDVFDVKERDIDEVVEQRDGHDVGFLSADAGDDEAVRRSRGTMLCCTKVTTTMSDAATA